jgi:hypothetical protein
VDCFRVRRNSSEIGGRREDYFLQAVPVQLVNATPSELEALITGGVYDPKKTHTAFYDAAN